MKKRSEIVMDVFKPIYEWSGIEMINYAKCVFTFGWVKFEFPTKKVAYKGWITDEKT